MLFVRVLPTKNLLSSSVRRVAHALSTKVSHERDTDVVPSRVTLFSADKRTTLTILNVVSTAQVGFWAWYLGVYAIYQPAPDAAAAMVETTDVMTWAGSFAALGLFGMVRFFTVRYISAIRYVRESESLQICRHTLFGEKSFEVPPFMMRVNDTRGKNYKAVRFTGRRFYYL